MTQTPQRIGRYQILDVLGRGGMATVYRAEDALLHRPVALKLLGESAREFRERFLAEARTVATLSHPNIVSIFDIGEYEGQPYLVMELVEGTTLAEGIREQRQMPLPRRLQIVEALARALDYAHGRGVVHRDVKPGNVMIDRDGVVRLLDFGIARVADLNITQTGAVMGTPNYMSPEQILGGALDRRTDIFSAGLVLYELLTGVRAFEGSSMVQVLRLITESEPAPIGQALTISHPDVERIASRALQKLADDRYQTAAEMADALARARERIERDGPGVSTQGPPVVGDVPMHRRAATPATSAAPATVQTRAGSEGGLRATMRRWWQRTWPQEQPSSPVRSAPTAPKSGTYSLSEFREPQARDEVPLSDRTVIVTRPSVTIRTTTRETTDDGTVFLAPSRAREESGSNARLLIVRSPDARSVGRTIDIGDAPFTLGRSAESSLSVGDAGWSRAHAVIECQSGGYAIRELGSANGTYVNGRRITEAQPLFFGASIRIGDTVLTFTPVHDLSLPDLTGVEIAKRYVLKRLIRESGKAVMYAATDRNVSREVATKLLSPGLVRFSGYREQFVREAEMASHLQHPNICQLLDSGQASVPLGDGTSALTLFLCFEMMAGGDLASRLEHLSDIGLDEISRWIGMLGSALHYAHGQGVVHGRLKPTAVVFDQAGHLYLTDFAIAQRALNMTGQPALGSPAYIAPEQWDSGAVTPATDQFAFSVIAYYLIAGSKPYEGLDHPEIRVQQFRRGPEAAHDTAVRNGRTPASRVVSDVLGRGLSTAPGDRYATVEHFTQALTRALTEGRRFGDVPQVFISYDREQSGGWVRFFADKLKDRHGIRVFVDHLGLDRAGRFPPRLVKAIEDCDVFVCFLARTTLDSKWVNEEIRLAHEHGKLMIPVFQQSYDESALETGNPVVNELISHQGIKLFDISGDYVDHAVGDLAAMIKGELWVTTLARFVRSDQHDPQDR